VKWSVHSVVVECCWGCVSPGVVFAGSNGGTACQVPRPHADSTAERQLTVVHLTAAAAAAAWCKHYCDVGRVATCDSVTRRDSCGDDADCQRVANQRTAARHTPVVYVRLVLCSPITLHCIEPTYSGSVAEWLACWTQTQKGPG